MKHLFNSPGRGHSDAARLAPLGPVPARMSVRDGRLIHIALSGGFDH